MRGRICLYAASFRNGCIFIAIMQSPEKLIEVYDKREKATSSVRVIELSSNVYRMVENDILNCRLTFGTEFKTRVNKDGKEEVIRIIKDSSFETRRFFLNSQFSVEEFRLLGDEIIKNGGFWQVDFGGIATVNLPRNCELDLDKIFKLFNFNPTNIK